MEEHTKIKTNTKIFNTIIVIYFKKSYLESLTCTKTI